MAKQAAFPFSLFSLAAGAAVLLALHLAGLYSFLLFHSLVEMFSIIVACGIFMIAWNSRRFLDNNYLLFIGISFLFVGVLDLLHTLAHGGMGMFEGGSENLTMQLWIAARYTGSLSLLIAPLLMGRRLNPRLVFGAYSAATALLLGAVFYWKIFPFCYVEGAGPTPFKIISEYVISTIFLAALSLLIWKRREFEGSVLWLLAASIFLRMGAELALMREVETYDLMNLLGHFSKVISFYLFYKALIESALVRPYDVLFRNLKKSEEALRKERDRAQNYLDVARAILVAIDADQRVSLINRTGCEILGYSESEIVGKNWFDHFIPETIRGEVRDVFIKLISGEVEPIEYFENPILTRNGEEKIIAWHNAVLTGPDGKIIATLSSGEDITEHKIWEEKLAQKTAELERSNEELDRFASIVSHDLKEPLLSIGGFAELLRQRHHDKLDDKGKRFLDHIINGTLRMELLISDLLAYARVGTVALPFEPVDLNTAFGAALSNLRVSIEECGAAVTSDNLPTVQGDPTQLIQLFQNLVGNAIKYRSEAPPRIHVSAKPVENSTVQSAIRNLKSEMKTGWIISVSDNGIGIAREHYEKIFQIFQRLHPGDKYPGTGIGLAICKKIVERHRGSIWVESGPGKGSTFYFTIP